MDTTEALAATNESAVKYATLVQEQVLDGFRSLTEPLTKDVPSISSWFPIAESASARELLEETFAFNSRMLELNKSFAMSLVDVLTPTSTAKSTKK